MHLPKPIYEAKPLIYIALTGIWFTINSDSLAVQIGFVMMNCWALCILFLRRGFRQGLIASSPEIQNASPDPVALLESMSPAWTGDLAPVGNMSN